MHNISNSHHYLSKSFQHFLAETLELLDDECPSIPPSSQHLVTSNLKTSNLCQCVRMLKCSKEVESYTTHPSDCFILFGTVFLRSVLIAACIRMYSNS